MTGNPPPTVRWMKNGEEVIPSDYFQMVVSHQLLLVKTKDRVHTKVHLTSSTPSKPARVPAKGRRGRPPPEGWSSQGDRA